MRTVLLILCLTASGCGMVRKLPPIKASEIRTQTSVMGVKVSADAVGVNVTEATMKVQDVKWTVDFPGFSHITTAKDYQQKLPKDDNK